MTIAAKLIAYSRGQFAPPLATLQLRYPKFIHGELMTHRVFSRNASSSRAIPVERLIQDVIDDPVYPSHWGANQRGMSADVECDADVRLPMAMFEDLHHTKDGAWREARDYAIAFARAFASAGYHKQIVNRLLEPFCHINVVVSSTQWSNFFSLRIHPAAQPEMRILAECIRDAIAQREPKFLQPGEWHTPYVNEEEDGVLFQDGMLAQRICVSVARCARVSYMSREGQRSVLQEDLDLYERLVHAQPMHASPAEHQATPTDQRHNRFGGNFDSEWIQYRKTLPGESR